MCTLPVHTSAVHRPPNRDNFKVVVTGGSAERIRWGDWGEAVAAFRYTHPRTGGAVEIRQAVRVPRELPFDLLVGARVPLICWGVMPSGMLRHPLLAAIK